MFDGQTADGTGGITTVPRDTNLLTTAILQEKGGTNLSETEGRKHNGQPKRYDHETAQLVGGRKEEDRREKGARPDIWTKKEWETQEFPEKISV